MQYETAVHGTSAAGLEVKVRAIVPVQRHMIGAPVEVVPKGFAQRTTCDGGVSDFPDRLRGRNSVDVRLRFHLNRVNSDEEYNRHYIDFVARGDALTPREAQARQPRIIESLPRQPGEALRALMKLAGVTREGLAERALVSDSTVRRWREEAYSFDAETALRIIVGLSLPPWLSYWLLETARVPLQFHGKHMVYRNIINCHYMDSMRE